MYVFARFLALLRIVDIKISVTSLSSHLVWCHFNTYEKNLITKRWRSFVLETWMKSSSRFTLLIYENNNYEFLTRFYFYVWRVQQFRQNPKLITRKEEEDENDSDLWLSKYRLIIPLYVFFRVLNKVAKRSVIFRSFVPLIIHTGSIENCTQATVACNVSLSLSLYIYVSVNV